jgi:hypothetical protein
MPNEAVPYSGRFGESNGYVALEDFNMSMQVTAITHRPSPVLASILSQVTPSEDIDPTRRGDVVACLSLQSDRGRACRTVPFHRPCAEIGTWQLGLDPPLALPPRTDPSRWLMRPI